MRRHGKQIAALAMVALITVMVPESFHAAGAPLLGTAHSSIASARDATSNTPPCKFGLMSAQLRNLTKAAAVGASGPVPGEIEALSKRLGIEQSAANALLRIVGEQPSVPDQRLAELLSKVATDYRRLQAGLAALKPSNSALRALVGRAGADIAADTCTGAHDLLTQARQAQIAAAQGALKLHDKAQAAADGELALTERRYLQATARFKQAAALVPPEHTTDTAGYLAREANALYRQGDEGGNNPALQSAIEVWQQVLPLRPRAHVVPESAATQASLGSALLVLGLHGSGTAPLEQAVAADRAALTERTPAREPLNWVRTQNNLGSALINLAYRHSGTAYLDQAAASRAGLTEWTHACAPLEWARAQNNLGFTLTQLGERESGTVHLQEAVAAFDAALSVYVPAHDEYDAACCRASLAEALVLLAQRKQKPRAPSLEQGGLQPLFLLPQRADNDVPGPLLATTQRGTPGRLTG